MSDFADLVAFVYHEARLLDEQRFDEWYDLYTEDARYWMPLTRGQPDGVSHTSLMYEDKLLLRVRIERLKNPHSFSQHPRSHAQHVLQAPQVESVDAATGIAILRTPFFYMESQMDESVILSGVIWHHLVRSEGHIRIRLKKIELVNCDAALPSIQLFV
jgi:3-phenylpropionate/cinnamic acid dioxygenase small subunit